jgi:hypothetical protein
LSIAHPSMVLPSKRSTRTYTAFSPTFSCSGELSKRTSGPLGPLHASLTVSLNTVPPDSWNGVASQPQPQSSMNTAESGVQTKARLPHSAVERAR